MSDETSKSGWEPPEIISVGTVKRRQQKWLETVTSKIKKNIISLSDVPPKLVLLKPVSTSMERPNTLRAIEAEGPWYPPLTESFLLTIPDSFIGDNVIFDSERYYSFGKWWLGNHEDSWKLYEKTREVRHIDMGMSVTSWGGEAFQLFILDTLPRLPAYFELLDQPGFANLKLVSHFRNCATAQWFWNMLGLTDRVVQKPLNAHEGFVLHADLALYQNWHPNLGTYGVHPRGSLLPIQQRLGILDGTTQDLVLYCGRQRGARSVLNREALVRRLTEVLKRTKLTLHEFEASGNLELDMELFKRALIILGPHGGALANMVFSQPGTHIIEFLPIYRLYREGTYPRPVYWGLAQAAGLDYWTVEPSGFDFERADMEVNVDEVANIVDQLV